MKSHWHDDIYCRIKGYLTRLETEASRRLLQALSKGPLKTFESVAMQQGIGPHRKKLLVETLLESGFTREEVMHEERGKFRVPTGTRTVITDEGRAELQRLNAPHQNAQSNELTQARQEIFPAVSSGNNSQQRPEHAHRNDRTLHASIHAPSPGLGRPA